MAIWKGFEFLICFNFNDMFWFLRKIVRVKNCIFWRENSNLYLKKWQKKNRPQCGLLKTSPKILNFWSLSPMVVVFPTRLISKAFIHNGRKKSCLKDFGRSEYIVSLGNVGKVKSFVAVLYNLWFFNCNLVFHFRFSW